MNAASISHDVIRDVRVEFSQLRTDNRSAWWNTFALRGLIRLSPATLIKKLSSNVGRIVAGWVGGAVTKMQKHVAVFRALREKLMEEGLDASAEEAVNVLQKLVKLEAALLESIPSYKRVATSLREINQNSKVAVEFDRLATVTEELYLLVLDVHHFFIGTENSIGRTWEAAVTASRENFQKVAARIAADEEEIDPELLDLAAKAVAASEQKGRTNDPHWARNLARSPLH